MPSTQKSHKGAAVELSEEDLALIHALQIAPRVSWTDAARVLGVHATTLAARWERLRDSGAAWVTAHLVGEPDKMSLTFLDVQCDLARMAEAVEAVCAIPEIITVEEAARNRDMMLTAITPSLAALSRDVIPRLAAIPGLNRYQASLCTELHRGGHGWRLNALTKAQQQAFAALRPRISGPAGPLPPSSQAMVPVLMRDGRATAVEVAKAVGGHPATVRRQLNRLLESGLLSFRCEMAQSYSGYPVTCQWFARVPAGRHQQIAKELATFRNARLIASTTGSTNFIIVMWLHSVADVMTAELAMAERVPELELVESAVVLNAAKRVGWRLAPDGRSTGVVVLPAGPTEPSGLELPA
ncbi:MAG TPA: AsnC family transcriptional regulator [Micrococcaceae bacterium]|nr:AsnC family transcriptional regulator [Micrococcaceae bacterium]